MSMRPQIPVRSSESEQALQFIRQMGIENVSLMLGPDELTAEAIRAQKNKLAAFGLRISDAACMELQKNKSIHLGLPDRDHEIDRFNQMLRVFGEEEIPFTSIAWQPNGILRTAWKVGEYTRGGVAMYCDQNEILARPHAEARWPAWPGAPAGSTTWSATAGPSGLPAAARPWGPSSASAAGWKAAATSAT